MAGPPERARLVSELELWLMNSIRFCRKLMASQRECAVLFPWKHKTLLILTATVTYSTQGSECAAEPLRSLGSFFLAFFFLTFRPTTAMSVDADVGSSSSFRGEAREIGRRRQHAFDLGPDLRRRAAPIHASHHALRLVVRQDRRGLRVIAALAGPAFG